MSDINSQLHAAASKNTELLGILGRTDYAHPALQQQKAYIKDLEHASASNKKRVSELRAALAKEQKEHESYKDSTMKRFAYRASGKKEKFEARQEKEEREYFDALHAEQRAKDEGAQISKQLDEARSAKKDLETAAAEHDHAQKELDSLYNSIFAGQTPSYPEEDQQENTVQGAWQEYQRLEGILRHNQQVQGILSGADRAMNGALGSVGEALSASTYDMFGGGMMADYMERSALGQAEMAVREAYRLNEQAQSMSNAVGPLPPVQIAQGNMLGDVLFDSTFSDYKFHQKIKATQDDLHRALMALRQNQQSVEQRSAELQQNMGQASQWLENARQQLRKVREDIFQRSAGQW